MIPPTMANHTNRSKKNPNRLRVPRAAEVKAAREDAGLTQAQAAAMVFVALRSWQQWESELHGDSRRMPPGLWQLFRLKVLARGENLSGSVSAILDELLHD